MSKNVTVSFRNFEIYIFNRKRREKNKSHKLHDLVRTVDLLEWHIKLYLRHWNAIFSWYYGISKTLAWYQCFFLIKWSWKLAWFHSLTGNFKPMNGSTCSTGWLHIQSTVQIAYTIYNQEFNTTHSSLLLIFKTKLVSDSACMIYFALHCNSWKLHSFSYLYLSVGFGDLYRTNRIRVFQYLACYAPFFKCTRILNATVFLKKSLFFLTLLRTIGRNQHLFWSIRTLVTLQLLQSSTFSFKMLPLSTVHGIVIFGVIFLVFSLENKCVVWSFHNWILERRWTIMSCRKA